MSDVGGGVAGVLSVSPLFLFGPSPQQTRQDTRGCKTYTDLGSEGVQLDDDFGVDGDRERARAGRQRFNLPLKGAMTMGPDGSGKLT